jgi:hypothetical protein
MFTPRDASKNIRISASETPLFAVRPQLTLFAVRPSPDFGAKSQERKARTAGPSRHGGLGMTQRQQSHSYRMTHTLIRRCSTRRAAVLRSFRNNARAHG